MTRPVIMGQTEFRKKFEEYVNNLTPEQAKQHGEELQAFADKKVSWRMRFEIPGIKRRQ